LRNIETLRFWGGLSNNRLMRRTTPAIFVVIQSPVLIRRDSGCSDFRHFDHDLDVTKLARVGVLKTHNAIAYRLAVALLHQKFCDRISQPAKNLFALR
jgi:hypothetical protein